MENATSGVPRFAAQNPARGATIIPEDDISYSSWNTSRESFGRFVGYPVENESHSLK
jgi:hypothetical protein